VKPRLLSTVVVHREACRFQALRSIRRGGDGGKCQKGGVKKALAVGVGRDRALHEGMEEIGGGEEEGDERRHEVS